MKFVPFRYIYSAIILFLYACNTALRPGSVAYEDYKIAAGNPSDSSLQRLLQPYRDSVNSSMNQVVNTAVATLEKAQPTGSLGNFMADAVLAMAVQKFNTKVDVAVINYGGIRSTQLPAGEVTRGKVFELMPFDNLLVLQKLNGAQLQELFNFMAKGGGWPVAGATAQIKDKKAINILIGGEPLQASKEYTLANSDYVANGGDGADFLKSIPQNSNGYLIRDALFDYIKLLAAQAKPIYNDTQLRMSHAE